MKEYHVLSAELDKKLDDLLNAGQVAPGWCQCFVCRDANKKVKDARKAIVDYIQALPVLWLSNKHVHECGSCGQCRECYHAQCQHSALADCDPHLGCHSDYRVPEERDSLMKANPKEPK